MEPAQVIITRSLRRDKLFTARIVRRNGLVKHVDFGTRDGVQYYLHHNDAIKRAWIARHSVRGRWDDPNSAGFWARWLLWNKTTLAESAEDIERRFEFPVSLQIGAD